MTIPGATSCPVCSQPSDTSPANRWRPFCSQRCQQLDLARWLDGDYRIPGDPVPNDGYAPEPGLGGDEA